MPCLCRGSARVQSVEPLQRSQAYGNQPDATLYCVNILEPMQRCEAGSAIDNEITTENTSQPTESLNSLKVRTIVDANAHVYPGLAIPHLPNCVNVIQALQAKNACVARAAINAKTTRDACNTSQCTEIQCRCVSACRIYQQ